MGDWRSGSAVALQANGHRFKSCISHHQLHATRLRGIFFSRAFSSAGEHFLHTEGVIGSIPVTPTTLSRSAYGRPFFVWDAMTLHGILAAQLPLKARLTHEVRLARAFTASALVRIPLADVLAHAQTKRDSSIWFLLV